MPVYERSILIHPILRSTAPATPPVALTERARHEPDDVCAVVLADAPGSGGPFERLLRGPLAPVAQTPIVHHAFDWLQQARVGEAIVCANDWNAAVRDAFGSGKSVGLSLGYYESHEPRGSAGAVHDAARRSSARTFVAVSGCMIPRVDLGAVLAAHRRARAAMTTVVEIERRARGRGSLPASTGGICVVDRRALTAVPARGALDLRELAQRLRERGERVETHEVHGLAPRVYDEESYASVSRWLVPRVVEQPRFLAGYVRRGAALIHPMAWVAPTARLLGPVIVGPGTRIEEEALVVGPVSIGLRARIGARATISSTVLWDECTVGAGATVDDSLLADGATVAAGERVARAVRAPRPVPQRRITWLSPAPSAAAVGAW